jgi:hypothetical protein
MPRRLPENASDNRSCPAPYSPRLLAMSVVDWNSRHAKPWMSAWSARCGCVMISEMSSPQLATCPSINNPSATRGTDRHPRGLEHVRMNRDMPDETPGVRLDDAQSQHGNPPHRTVTPPIPARPSRHRIYRRCGTEWRCNRAEVPARAGRRTLSSQLRCHPDLRSSGRGSGVSQPDPHHSLVGLRTAYVFDRLPQDRS